MNKKFTLLVILTLIIVGGYFIVKKYQTPVSPEKPNTTPTQTPDMSLDPKEAEYQNYLMEGMNYRTAGMQGDIDAYYKAIDSYKKAVEFSEGKVWVPYLNLGNTYRLVEEYENAEDAYDKALEITAGESMIYLAKIEMYRYEMKKSDADIGKVYEDALKVVMDNANLVISYAAFLRDVGKYEEAIKYYQILLERYPDKQAYKEEIEFLRSKL